MELPKNRGYGAAANAGATLAPGADVLIMNPDAFLEPGCAQALSSRLAAYPALGWSPPAC